MPLRDATQSTETVLRSNLALHWMPSMKNSIMAKGCWCNLKFHLPGEKSRHQKASTEAERLIALAKAVEERGKRE